MRTSLQSLKNLRWLLSGTGRGAGWISGVIW